MSNTDHIASVPTEGTIVKPSLVKRGVNFVKSHKKATIAVSILVGLNVANVIAARKNVNATVLPEDPADYPVE
jgi:hypothetical protein